MAKGILGRKIGMTQVFDENGVLIPVTVIDVYGNTVLQQKNEEQDGYTATQLGYDSKRESLSNKPEMGHVKKANSAPKRFVREIRFKAQENELANLEVGTVLKADLFEAGEVIDVTGTSKGKGFAGTIKRHNVSGGFMTHGSRYHRGPGSMGAIKGKLKGKKLPGQMGNKQMTVQNLKIVKALKDEDVILVSGAVPGPNKGLVIIKTAVKKGN